MILRHRQVLLVISLESGGESKTARAVPELSVQTRFRVRRFACFRELAATIAARSRSRSPPRAPERKLQPAHRIARHLPVVPIQLPYLRQTLWMPVPGVIARRSRNQV